MTIIATDAVHQIRQTDPDLAELIRGPCKGVVFHNLPPLGNEAGKQRLLMNGCSKGAVCFSSNQSGWKGCVVADV